MLLKADAQQLEWRTKVFLSQDPVALREIQNNEDLHSDNQKFFQLPNRTIAKNFLYISGRLLQIYYLDIFL